MKSKITLPRVSLSPYTRSRFMAEREPLVEGRVNKGIVTAIHAADIPTGALTQAKEARCRYDVTSRRPGKTIITPAKPNANKILNLSMFKANDKSTHFFRFTRNSIHERGVGVWTVYNAGAGGSITGADTDRFQTAVVFNKLFFANGVDKIQFLDTAATTYKEAGTNAPKVKYITGFFNRVVGAYRVEGSEPNGASSIVWCADGDTTKWPNDGSPDPSSGQSSLVESPSDLADFITGVFGFDNVLLITREKSIWGATKTPVGSAPFNAYTAVPGLGCDCPYGTIVIPGGIAFVDTLSSTVWVYRIGGNVERIGEPVEKDLISAISDPSLVFGGFDTTTSEGSWAIPLAGSTIVRVWTFNFRTKAWVYDEIDALSEISDIDSPFTSTLRFDDLPGTFDSLTGTFDGLVNTTAAGIPARYYGYNDGTILQEDASAITDNGVAFTMDLQSKEFTAPTEDSYFAKIRIDYISKIAGTLTLQYSRDSGKTWRAAKSVSMVPDVQGIIKYIRQIKARTLRWRLLASDGRPDILAYAIDVSPSGDSRK